MDDIEPFWPKENEKPNWVLASALKLHLYWLYILLDSHEREMHRQYLEWEREVATTTSGR